MRRALVLFLLLSFCIAALAGAPTKRSSRPASRPPVVAHSSRPKTPPRKAKRRTPAKRKPAQPATFRGPWKEPTFANSTAEDNVDGEDLDVRRAAVAGLGAYN